MTVLWSWLQCCWKIFTCQLAWHWNIGIPLLEIRELAVRVSESQSLGFIVCLCLWSAVLWCLMLMFWPFHSFNQFRHCYVSLQSIKSHAMQCILYFNLVGRVWRVTLHLGMLGEEIAKLGMVPFAKHRRTLSNVKSLKIVCTQPEPITPWTPNPEPHPEL